MRPLWPRVPRPARSIRLAALRRTERRTTHSVWSVAMKCCAMMRCGWRTKCTVLANPNVQERFHVLGTYTRNLTPEQTGEFMAAKNNCGGRSSVRLRRRIRGRRAERRTSAVTAMVQGASPENAPAAFLRVWRWHQRASRAALAMFRRMSGP
jgi:hypothetical protein